MKHLAVTLRAAALCSSWLCEAPHRCDPPSRVLQRTRGGDAGVLPVRPNSHRKPVLAVATRGPSGVVSRTTPPRSPQPWLEHAGVHIRAGAAALGIAVQGAWAWRRGVQAKAGWTLGLGENERGEKRPGGGVGGRRVFTEQSRGRGKGEDTEWEEEGGEGPERQARKGRGRNQGKRAARLAKEYGLELIELSPGELSKVVSWTALPDETVEAVALAKALTKKGKNGWRRQVGFIGGLIRGTSAGLLKDAIRAAKEGRPFNAPEPEPEPEPELGLASNSDQAQQDTNLPSHVVSLEPRH